MALVVKVAQWEGMRMEKCATKRVLKLLNDRIFEKALSVDVACYENPEFYDKYQRATMVTTNSFFDLICFDFFCLCGGCGGAGVRDGHRGGGAPAVSAVFGVRCSLCSP